MMQFVILVILTFFCHWRVVFVTRCVVQTMRLAIFVTISVHLLFPLSFIVSQIMLLWLHRSAVIHCGALTLVR